MSFLLVVILLSFLLCIETFLLVVTAELISQLFKAILSEKVICIVGVATYIVTIYVGFLAMIKLLGEYFAVI